MKQGASLDERGYLSKTEVEERQGVSEIHSLTRLKQGTAIFLCRTLPIGWSIPCVSAFWAWPACRIGQGLPLMEGIYGAERLVGARVAREQTLFDFFLSLTHLPPSRVGLRLQSFCFSKVRVWTGLNEMTNIDDISRADQGKIHGQAAEPHKVHWRLRVCSDTLMKLIA